MPPVIASTFYDCDAKRTHGSEICPFFFFFRVSSCRSLFSFFVADKLMEASPVYISKERDCGGCVCFIACGHLRVVEKESCIFRDHVVCVLSKLVKRFWNQNDCGRSIRCAAAAFARLWISRSRGAIISDDFASLSLSLSRWRWPMLAGTSDLAAGTLPTCEIHYTATCFPSCHTAHWLEIDNERAIMNRAPSQREREGGFKWTRIGEIRLVPLYTNGVVK